MLAMEFGKGRDNKKVYCVVLVIIHTHFYGVTGKCN